jgi:hypothetical protein
MIAAQIENDLGRSTRVKALASHPVPRLDSCVNLSRKTHLDGRSRNHQLCPREDYSPIAVVADLTTSFKSSSETESLQGTVITAYRLRKGR